MLCGGLVCSETPRLALQAAFTSVCQKEEAHVRLAGFLAEPNGEKIGAQPWPESTGKCERARSVLDDVIS